MTALRNAREYADGFVYFQSGIRRPVEIDGTTARLRDLLLLRTAVSELVREKVERPCDEYSPATDSVFVQLLQGVLDAAPDMYQDLTAQPAPTSDGGGE